MAATPRTVILADNDLNIISGEDIYVTGETSIGAVADLRLQAARRIGVLGAINTNFRLNVGNGTRDVGHFEEKVTLVTTSSRTCGSDGKNCSTSYSQIPVAEQVWVKTGTEAYNDLAYDSFAEIGETLQLGTLMRNPYLAETPTPGTGTDEVDRLAYARHTSLYDLTATVISAGGDLSLESGGDILNFGGSVVSGENMVITAETDIRNEALRHNFTLKAANGCVGYGCGRLGHEYKAGEFLSGSGLIMSAGGDIINNGASIAAAGSLLANAEGDIVNTALSSQYLYHYINSSSFFGLKRRVEILHRAIINEGSIATEYGDLDLNAGNDIRSVGSKISAGSDVTLTAAKDILLEAEAEELANYRKVRKFVFIGIAQDQTSWNEFKTAFSVVEGNSINLNAGRHVTGIGSRMFAAGDIAVVAGENITFDAHQNNRYEHSKGWSFAISFGGSGIIAALLDNGDTLEAYAATNPTLGAVHQLATGKGNTFNGLLKLAYHAPALGQAIGLGAEGAVDFNQSLATTLNPFSWTKNSPIFNKDLRNVVKDGVSEAANLKDYLSGITFRFGVHKSSREWTESYVSQVIAGQDLWLDSGKDISLAGGTVTSANRDAMLYAGENVMVSALSDTTRSSASSWGLSLGFGPTGVTFGADFNKSHGQSEMFTNATLTAGEYLDVISGQDTVLMGANVKARNVYFDVGENFIVQSRQNTSASDSFGFSFSTNPIDLALSGGINFSDANRQYTDTPTSIVAEDRLSVHTGNTTFLLGSTMYSDVGNLTIDTGKLVFDNYTDTDTSISGGIGFSLAFEEGKYNGQETDANGSLAYRNKDAITYATIGAGTINVREAEADFHLNELNRDRDNVQEIISETDFAIEIPGINLKRWKKQVEDSVNLIEAVTANVPAQIRNEGRQAVDQFRDLIFQGLSKEEAAQLVATPKYRNFLKGRIAYEQAVARGSLSPRNKVLAIAMILNGEKLNYDDSSDELLAIVGCGTSGGYCAVPCGAVDLKSLAYLSDQEVESFLLDALSKAFAQEVDLVTGLPEASRKVVDEEALKLAIECAIAWAAQGGDSSIGPGNASFIFEAVGDLIPDTSEYAVWRSRLDVAHDISGNHGLAMGILVDHNQFNGHSFDIVEIIRLANSESPSDREDGWDLAQKITEELAVENAFSPELMVANGLILGVILREFADVPDAANLLQTISDDAALDAVANLEDLKAELGIFGATAVVLASGFRLKQRYMTTRSRFSAPNTEPRVISRSDGQTLDPSRISVPGPTNAGEGKTGFLLGRVDDAGGKSAQRATVFRDKLGFDDDTLSVGLNRHLQDNFASGIVGPSTHASNVGTITVKGPITGPNGTTEIVTSGWSIRADGSVTLNTAW